MLVLKSLFQRHVDASPRVEPRVEPSDCLPSGFTLLILGRDEVGNRPPVAGDSHPLAMFHGPKEFR